MKLTKKSVITALRSPASKWQTVLLVLASSLLYVYRALPYFLKPQLYAEDGTLWLSKATHEGFNPIFQPYHGFFHTAERLFGYVVAHFPLQWAPLIFALTAWALFIATVYYLLSDRTKILTGNYERIFTVLSLALIANFHEFFFNFSNSIFLAGIIGALILIAQKPANKYVDAIEKAFFLVTSLTLTFPWLYLPMALVLRFKYKIKNNYFLVVSLLASIAQAVTYLTGKTDRSPVTLFSLFSKYTLLELYNQIIIPAARFARVDIGLADFQGNYHIAVVSFTVALVLLASVLILKKANRQVCLLLFFLAGMTFASVKSPTLSVNSAVEALRTMAVEPGANRYFVYGIVAVNIILAKATYQVVAAKARYWFLAIFMVFGLFSSIHYHAFYVDKHWDDYTAQYREQVDLLNSGKKNIVTIPSNPRPWSMTLGRH